MSETVMFVHGAWLTPLSWEHFRARFESRGYHCVAPAWPYLDRPIAEVRRQPDPDFAKLTIHKVVDHFEREVKKCAEPPILVGHSMGGLIVQMLADRGYGEVVVALDSVAPRFVLPRFHAFVSAAPVLTAWGGWNRAVTMSFSQFARNFANDLPQPEQRQAYDRYVVPTPGRIYHELAWGIGNGVNHKKPNRAPMLLIAGESDRTIEASMVHASYKSYRHGPSLVEFKTFPHRSHFLFGSPGWQEVADYSMNWIEAHIPPDASHPAPYVTTHVASQAAAEPAMMH